MEKTKLDFYENSNFKKYCPEKNCDSELEKITIGFLWLLERYFTIYRNKGYGDDTNSFFLYMISWFSYKLKKNSESDSTTINDFYNENVINGDKYSQFKKDSSKFTGLDEVLNKKSDFLNINIKDLSEFYDAFKLICSMYGNVETNTNDDTLPNNGTLFFNKYTKLNDECKIKSTARSKIFSALSTDYNTFKNYCTRRGANCKDFSSLPEITEFSALESTSGDTSSSASIGNKFFTVLSIFGAIGLFLGISYKKLSIGNFYVAEPICGLELSIISLFNFL
ncbi:hypothetical protein YYC_02836 [Plasmodium yoelii 17X]|uniref:Uncharacterized protein n=1 Tax=Plasmodium yoelii 17X TaxID=1323249 RepID=V7PLW2_PLAYE|nr:hypothetical protein YYC_02836 [Plasmodium yoelii 17X]